MRLAALITLAFATLATAQWSGNDLNSVVCDVLDANDGSLPWPFPSSRSTPSSRKLLEAEDLTNSGRSVNTVTLYWSLWRTEAGKCATTTKLPPTFVTAATLDNQKVAPGGSCDKAQSGITQLNTAVLKKYAKKCPKSTSADIALNRICKYTYGSRASFAYAGKLTCRTLTRKSIINVWAQSYTVPPSVEVGTWF